MSPGSHAAGDGSFGRSAGIQAGRAAILLIVAVLIGLALLHRGTGGSGLVSAGGTTTTSPFSSVGSDTTLRTSTNTTRPSSSSSTTTTPPLRAKADIKVLVANGTNTPGLAGTVSTSLRGKGYNTLASINSTLKVATTSIYFQPGYDGDAVAMAAVLGVPASAAKPMPATLPVPSIGGANILVVVGPDAATTSSTTSTTSRTASTAGRTTTT